MSLKDHLAAIRAKSKPSATSADIMRRTRSELAASGQAATVPTVGEVAPSFTLPNVYGDPVSSERILAKGPLVLHFFRGGW
ncbi:MAG: hypothetical protein C0615_07880 [Desulfuromonas sp.]|nr:MAG: hypothetical protein C0615_07880 [Desulfuromonas sp.]